MDDTDECSDRTSFPAATAATSNATNRTKSSSAHLLVALCDRLFRIGVAVPGWLFNEVESGCVVHRDRVLFCRFAHLRSELHSAACGSPERGTTFVPAKSNRYFFRAESSVPQPARTPAVGRSVHLDGPALSDLFVRIRATYHSGTNCRAGEAADGEYGKFGGNAGET